MLQYAQKIKKYFGKIGNGKMILNGLGKITEKLLVEISKHFSNITVDEFVIMPKSCSCNYYKRK
jgi:hypothetical protein